MKKKTMQSNNASTKRRTRTREGQICGSVPPGRPLQGREKTTPTTGDRALFRATEGQAGGAWGTKGHTTAKKQNKGSTGKKQSRYGKARSLKHSSK